MTPAVQVRGLTVQHASRTSPAVVDLDLELAPGEKLALLGASGAGKSTLLRALLGAGPLTRGTVRVGGHDPFAGSRRAVRRGTGLVVQGGDLVPGLSLRSNVLAGSTHLLDAAGWWHLLRGRSALPRLEQLAAQQGLAGLLDVRVQQLSGGQRQRAALLRALLPEPALLLADEPTTGLDGPAAVRAVDALLGQQVGLVVATHDPSVAARFDRIVVLRDGRVVHDGARPGPVELAFLYDGAA